METGKILLIAGEGGHLEQARRFNAILNKELGLDLRLKILSDKKPRFGQDDILVCHPMRGKDKSAIFRLPLDILSCTISVINILRREQPQMLISFGPGIAIPAALYAKLTKTEFIHFESWSRFTTFSITSKLIRALGFKILVQNQSLSKYENVEYVGRL